MLASLLLQRRLQLLNAGLQLGPGFLLLRLYVRRRQCCTCQKRIALFW